MKEADASTLELEVRRGGGEWEPLGLAGLHTGHRFVDNRPLLVPGEPEIREYRMRFWADEGPRGQWSSIAQATVSP